MPKLTTYLNQPIPRILCMTIEFDNGKLIELQATQVERLDLLQWVGPKQPQLVGDVRFIFPAEKLGLELENYRE